MSFPSPALALMARWACDRATAPIRPDEADAVARLRLGQWARLPRVEREALFRLLRETPDPQADGGNDRQEGRHPWH